MLTLVMLLGLLPGTAFAVGEIEFGGWWFTKENYRGTEVVSGFGVDFYADITDMPVSDIEDFYNNP